MRNKTLRLLINDIVTGKTLKELHSLKYRYMEYMLDGLISENDYYIINDEFNKIIERWEKNHE